MKIIDLIKKGKIIPLALTALVIGVLLLMFADKDKSRENEVEINQFEFDFSSYESSLESRISAMLNRLEGVSECETTILLDCSHTVEYVRDNDGSVFVYEYDGSDMTLVECKLAPKVRGVAVVCMGGDRAEVKAQITQMLCSLLDLSTNDVWVGGKE